MRLIRGVRSQAVAGAASNGLLTFFDHFWQFEETGSSNRLDSIASLDLTCENGITDLAGKIGNGITGTGAFSKAYGSLTASLPFCWMGWIKMTEGFAFNLLSFSSSNGQVGIRIQSNDRMTINCFGASLFGKLLGVNALLVDNEWNHFVFDLRAAQQDFWINGVKEYSGTDTLSGTQSQIAFWPDSIHAYDEVGIAMGYSGTIDDLIAAHYAGGSGLAFNSFD